MFTLWTKNIIPEEWEFADLSLNGISAGQIAAIYLNNTLRWYHRHNMGNRKSIFHYESFC